MVLKTYERFRKETLRLLSQSRRKVGKSRTNIDDLTDYIEGYLKSCNIDELKKISTVLYITKPQDIIKIFEYLQRTKILIPSSRTILNWLSYDFLYQHWKEDKYVFPLLLFFPSNKTIRKEIFFGKNTDIYIPNSHYFYKQFEHIKFLTGNIYFGMYLQIFQKGENELSDEYKHYYNNNEITVMTMIKNPTIKLLFDRISYWFSLIPLKNGIIRFMGIERIKENTYGVKWDNI